MAVIRLDPEAPQKTFDIFVNLVEFGHPACIRILLVPRFIEGVGRASEPNTASAVFPWLSFMVAKETVEPVSG
jgi:hypothetical protein